MITGTFGADFSAFQSAVDGAVTKLIAFEGNATTVTNSLSRMEKSFSGVKIIQDATLMADAIERVGGISKLTAAELEQAGLKAEEAAEKMVAMGIKVPPGLQNIITAAHDAGGAWSDFVHDFSATDAIEHPLATATAGVKALATEMGPTAVAAVGLATAVGAVAVAAFELTDRAAKVGGQLNDMNERTGVGVVQLSKYSNALQVAGGTLDTFGDAFFKLQKGLGEDSQKVADGLDKIGISVADLKAVGPDQYLELIAAGFAATDDPAKRAAAAAEIFRDKTGQMIPVLLKLNEGLRQTADIPVWSPQQAADAEKFEMQLANLKVHAEALATSIGRELIPKVSGFIDVAGPWVEWMARQTLELTGLPSKVRTAGEAFDYLSAAYDVFKGKTELPITIHVDTAEAQKKLDDIKDKAYAVANAPDQFEKNWVKAFTGAGPAIADVTTAMQNLKAMQDDTSNVTKEQADAAVKLQDAYADLANTGNGWIGTINKMDGAVVEQIASYKEAGAQVSSLKLIYSDLSESQFAAIDKLIAQRHREASEMAKDEADKQQLELKTAEMTTKLWDDYALVEASHISTATGLKKAALDKQYNDASATATRMGIVDADYWTALDARWKQGTASLGVDWQALQHANTYESKRGLQEIADGAQATYQEALKHVGEWSDGSIERFRRTAEAAQQAADNFGTAWSDNADRAKSKVDDMTSSVIGSIHAIAAASASATIPQGATSPYPDTPEGRIHQLADQQARNPAQFINASGLFAGLPTFPSFGNGGTGDFGSGTLAMLHGREAVVPLDSGGSDIRYGGIVPMAAAGITINTTIQITQPFGTPDQIARIVGEAQVNVLKGQGVRLPYGT